MKKLEHSHDDKDNDNADDGIDDDLISGWMVMRILKLMLT